MNVYPRAPCFFARVCFIYTHHNLKQNLPNSTSPSIPHFSILNNNLHTKCQSVFFFFFLLYNPVLVLPYIYIPLLGIHTKETRIEKDTCTPMFIVALFIIARTWKQSVFLIKRPTCSAHREPHDCQCFSSVSYIQNGNKAIQYVTY